MNSFPVELERVHKLIVEREATLASLPTTSNPAQIQKSLNELPTTLPATGIGLTATIDALLHSIAPALSNHNARFFGLVTGGVTAPSLLADQLVSSFDSCVQVNLPNETISTIIETITLHFILSLLSLPSARFTGNALTSGATTSNIQGLAIGREYVIDAVLHRQGKLAADERWSVAERGLCAGVEVEALVAVPHASIAKAASVVGIGRANVVDLRSTSRIGCFDLAKLAQRLEENRGRKGSIVVVSFGEVNTGAIESGLIEIRRLCDLHDAWLHIDAAFGAFAVLHPDFAHLSSELALADSITADAHKWLNTPYAGGIFLSRSGELVLDVLGPGGNVPAYLTPAVSSLHNDGTKDEKMGKEEEGGEPPLSTLAYHQRTPSPLFQNLENSRRFIALPIYASLISLGRSGYEEIVRRNIEFTRKVEKWMRDGGAGDAYEVLTPLSSLSRSMTDGKEKDEFKTLNILLFAPSPLAPLPFSHPRNGSTALLAALNESKEVYFTPTNWNGRPAIRMAVSNHATEEIEGRDWEILVQVLERVMREARECLIE